ncbi:HypC/HybG/HupF family hydrogenase formation chaperone [archaeon]|nr:HypC/HybG/HupF family hydrogenase formation chaperone [archaeon]
MCLKYPVEVVEVNKDEVVVDWGGEFKKVLAMDEIKQGDYVLVQNGIVVEVVDRKAREFFEKHGC